MSVRYNKRFKLLIDLKKSPSRLVHEVQISPNIVSGLKKMNMCHWEVTLTDSL